MGKSCVEEDNRPPPKGWPKDGSVELDDIYFDYRIDAPCALNGVSVTIESGQKIGVCGRTGAGKSTMISVLFSLGPLKSGKVTLGGHDVSVHAPRGCRLSALRVPDAPPLPPRCQWRVHSWPASRATTCVHRWRSCRSRPRYSTVSAAAAAAAAAAVAAAVASAPWASHGQQLLILELAEHGRMRDLTD
eukprot:COSAG01_NODE_275_length_19669_cov_8.676188_26_plen_189_part_00